MPNGNLYEIEQLPENGLTAIDLFCGAGIGAYGIKRAGFDIVYGIDNEQFAVDTYNINIGNHAICGDIRNLKKEDIPEHDLMIATPVCKPFSICGSRKLTKDAIYGDLLFETVRILDLCRPKAFFFENVAGLVLGESIHVFNDLIMDIESMGYVVYWELINCWDYGVPQDRERVFIVAIRKDIPYEFIPPKKLLFGKKTQKDAFYDLQNKTIADIKNHNTTLWHDYATFIVRNRQRPWDMPANTVISDVDSVCFYPEPFLSPKNRKRSTAKTKYNITAPRKLSVRETLRLQTVGDDFFFSDDIKLSNQYTRCSGIPSLIAYKFGIAIHQCLTGNTPERKGDVKMKKLF